MSADAVDTGYDPGRIDQLAHRTIGALAALEAVRSDDPAAIEAMRVVRLARRNLEHLWLPALHEIQRTDVMLSWTSADLSFSALAGARPLGGTLPAHLRPRGTPGAPTSLAGSTDNELIGRVRWLDRVRSGRPDLPPTIDDDLDELARELARRLRSSPSLADELVALAPSTTTIAHLLGAASFPSAFVAQVITAMTGPAGPGGTADLDAYAGAVSSALHALSRDPAACLDLLADTGVLYALASWSRLDPEAVSRVVSAGLSDAIADDSSLLTEGYDVLRDLVVMTNGPLDHGMAPGMARAVAASLGTFVDTLAPAIIHSGPKPVDVSADVLRRPVDLGAYDDVAGLLGAVLRDEIAATSLGIVLGAYTDRVVWDLGPEPLKAVELKPLVSLVALIDAAAAAEQQQMIEEAEMVEAHRRQTGALIGVGVSVALGATGVGPAVRAGAIVVIRAAVDRFGAVDPQQLSVRSLSQDVFDRASLSIVAAAVADPRVLRSAGHEPLTRSQKADLTRRLEVIADCTDIDERDRSISDLEQHLDENVGALHDHLQAIRSGSGLDALR